MRLPRVPEDISRVSVRDLQRLLGHPELRKVEIEFKGRYLHWEELRHRTPPGGLAPERWWRVVRIARLQASRDLPLTDSAGKPFSFVTTNTSQRLVHEVDRDASGRIELPEDIANHATRDRYVVASLIEEAFRSSQLEGASTTRSVAKEMIRTGRPPRTTSERMILNNFHAMEWVRDHKGSALTAASVLELHGIVTQDTLEPADGASRFRRADEEVRVISLDDGEVLHVPLPAESLAERMEALCRFANGTAKDEPFIHPVVRAILVHFWLAYDHPFVDGNGRTARALFYWSMLNQGYWLMEFISISRVIKATRAQYDRAFLYSETDSNDTTYFIFNQLKVLRTAIDDLHGYLKRKAQELRSVEDRIRNRDDLNHRQIALLADMLRHPDMRVTIDGHRTAHRIVYETARTDLLGLVTAGFVVQTKIGKKLFFSPVQELAKRFQ
jgi:Fic family protein